MKIKALTFGAMLGFLVAVAPSCGTATCGPSNCDGCCDSASKCVPKTASSSNSACGQGGATCADCTATSKVCSSTFTCAAVSGTGGGTATGGGTTGTGGGTATGGGVATGGGSSTGGGIATGGGAATGGSGGASGCDVANQTGCAAGESCQFVDANTTRCYAGACDVVRQNCPVGTDKCDYAQFEDGGVGRICQPNGTQQEGQMCNATVGACAKGLVCAGGVCTKYCYNDTDCGAANKLCLVTVSIPGTTEMPTACYTVQGCDPLNQTSCPAMQGCYLANMGAICQPAGTTPIGTACGNTTPQCVPGSACVAGPGQPFQCHAYCNTDGGMPNCGTGQCAGLMLADGGAGAAGACL